MVNYKTLLNLLFLLVVIFLNVSAQDLHEFDVNFNSGYQVENFGWSIAGNLNGQNPNIYSELKWKLKEVTTSAKLNWHLFHRFYILADYEHNFVTNGNVGDTDYGSDNRSILIYHGDFRDNKGYTDEAQLGLGYVAVTKKNMKLSVEAGINYANQSLYLLDLDGKNPTLNTSYFTMWRGGFFSGDFIYTVSKKISLEEALTYSQLSYNARADWNLIAQFAHPVSYRDMAEGFCIQTRSSITYQFNKRLSINLGAGYAHRQTGTGIDKLYLADSGVEQTQFNMAKGQCYQVSAGIFLKIN